MQKVDPPKSGHFRWGQLCSLLAKNPSKWLFYENFVALVTKKVHFEPFRGFLAKSEDTQIHGHKMDTELDNT